MSFSNFFFFCTGEGTRTPTSKTLDPKSSASTNSATPAQLLSRLRCKGTTFIHTKKLNTNKCENIVHYYCSEYNFAE